jgi:hypothetical protein
MVKVLSIAIFLGAMAIGTYQFNYPTKASKQKSKVANLVRCSSGRIAPNPAACERPDTDT